MANYLYNGVELPAWPATHHPYMAIFRHRDDSTKYRLWFSEDGIVYNNDGNARYEIRGHSVLYNLEENKWVKYSESPGGYGSVIDTAYYPIFWSSHDILRQNGDVYFEATPAINAETGEEVYYSPVTPPTIDPTALLMGYRVGCALRAQRGKQ